MNIDLAYDFCEAVTAQEAKNFAYGIRLLRRPERRALSAVYALARRIDDIGDGSAAPELKLAGLQTVRKEIDPIDPQTNDPVLVAVADAAGRYGLSMSCFSEIIDGCEMDVTGTCYETIDDLVGYCRRVAGSVGRLSLAVFGSSDPEQAVALADALGVALQLTNILRDIIEDRSLGRVYLPREDAESVACDPSLTGSPSEIARLVALECRRAEEWFAEGLQLLPLLDGRGRACVSAMAGIYRRLLRRIEADPTAVTRGPRLAPGVGEGPCRRPQPGRGTPMSPAKIGVVGGGLGGLAAALSARDAGAEVVLFERRLVLGGLTSSIRRNGLSFDNGQHVFLRCCSAYRSFVDRIGANDKVLLQDRMDVPVLAPGRSRASIKAAALPAPLHLASSLARYHHLSLRERLRLGRPALALGRLDPDDPALDEVCFGDWLARKGQSERAIERLWNLIALPTLNVSAGEASLGLATKVFRVGLLDRSDAGDIGWSTVPLGQLHGEMPAAGT